MMSRILYSKNLILSIILSLPAATTKPYFSLPLC